MYCCISYSYCCISYFMKEQFKNLIYVCQSLFAALVSTFCRSSVYHPSVFHPSVHRPSVHRPSVLHCISYIYIVTQISAQANCWLVGKIYHHLKLHYTTFEFQFVIYIIYTSGPSFCLVDCGGKGSRERSPAAAGSFGNFFWEIGAFLMP